MNIVLSFPYESFKGTSEAFNYILNFINFNIEGILSPREYQGFVKFDLDEIIKYLDNNKLDTFNIISNYSINFDFKNSVVFRRSKNKDLNIFICSIEEQNGINLSNLIKSAKEKNFTMGLLYDSSKTKWQNEKIITNFKTFNKPYEHLPKIWDSKLSPMYGEIIDISKNPGHICETFQIVLMAAPEMWFGPGSWKFFDKSLVESFPDAIKINIIFPDVIHVKLFNYTALNYEIIDILTLQRRFRDWIKMNEIEEKLNKKIIISNNVVTLKSIKQNLK